MSVVNINLEDWMKLNDTIEKDQQQIAALEVERNAWREDAEILNMSLGALRYVQNDTPRHVFDALDHHRQLHERYSTEKSDTDKGE